MSAAPATSRVHIVGTGLIGTSLGLALSRAGWSVTLEDQSVTTTALARDLGAGSLDHDASGADPDLVVVATPPDVTASVVASALERWPAAVVTDGAPREGASPPHLWAQGGAPRSPRSHPRAGRERSGAISGRAGLFHGRAWVLTPTPETSAAGVDLVRRAALAT